MQRQNHVIDPTFFDDAIDEFAFDYNWFVRSEQKVDDLGRLYHSFEKLIINGSLQPQNSTLNQSTTGNTTSLKYMFYCKSLYRINIGDYIQYNDMYLYVDGVQNYDEWGVRQVSLTMVNLNQHKDLQEYIRYLTGEDII